MKNTVPITCVLILAMQIAFGQTDFPSINGRVQNTYAAPPAEIADSLKRFLSAYKFIAPGGVIDVWMPGKWRWKDATGLADIGDGIGFGATRAAQSDDKFRIGSISKNFTAVAILKLVNAKRITLDDKVIQYLTSPTAAKLPNINQVTIRQCLNHTSGIATFDSNPSWLIIALSDIQRSLSAEELYQFALELQPLALPGNDTARYSNTNYLILKDIIEKVTQSSYPDFVQSSILTPAGMQNTSVAYGDALTGSYLRGYYPYSVNPNLYYDYTLANMDWAMGLGNIISNTHDLNNYFNLLLTGRLLPMNQVESMITNGAYFSPNVKYGFGTILYKDQSRDFVFHTGDLFGWHTAMFYSKTTDTYISYCYNNYNNNDNHPHTRILAKINDLLSRYYGPLMAARTSSEDQKPNLNFKLLQGDEKIVAEAARPSGLANVDVYPNPTTESFTIRYNDDSECQTLSVKITDMKGAKVYQTAFTPPLQAYDVKDLNKGIYILTIYNGGQVLFKKRMVVK
jgi:D-alanyl-D-alanine carboxypeptidase